MQYININVQLIFLTLFYGKIWSLEYFLNMEYLFRTMGLMIILLFSLLIIIMIFANVMIKVAYLVESKGTLFYRTIKRLFVSVNS